MSATENSHYEQHHGIEGIATRAALHAAGREEAEQKQAGDAWQHDGKHTLTKLLPQFHRGFSMSSWRRLDQRCRQLGIEPIYVVMPTMSWGFQGRDAVAELGDQAFVLDLDDPANHPTLFEIGLYYDPSHLNQEGSSFFSRYLAEQMVMRLAAKGPAPTKLK